MVLAVKAVNLSIGYLQDYEDKPVWIVKNVDLEVDKGEILCLIGESGCGKTTLASAIAGILPPHSVTSGKLYIFDKLVIDGERRDFNGVRGKLVSYIPQNPGTSLNPYLTISDHFNRVLRSLYGYSEAMSRKIAAEYLRMVGLDEELLEYYPHELSGGMQQRTTIAIALATGARIIVADEPTSTVDAHSKYQIVELLSKLARGRDLTLILVTHEIHVARRICDRVALMYFGKIVEMGRTAVVTETPSHPYTVALLEATPLLGHLKLLKPLPGEPPDFSEEIKGCPLYPRCPVKNETLCLKEPPLFQVNEAHYARCWLIKRGER